MTAKRLIHGKATEAPSEDIELAHSAFRKSEADLTGSLVFAHDQLDAAKAKLAKAREALEPFAAFAAKAKAFVAARAKDGGSPILESNKDFCLKDFKRAAEVLAVLASPEKPE